MLLSEIYEQLTVGELSQVHIGGSEDGGIRPEDYLKMLPHVNLGLTILHRRFFLREGRLIIELQPDRQVYPLKSIYASTHRRAVEGQIFIRDTPDAPFDATVLKIEQVFTDRGWQLTINDRNDPYTLTTPDLFTLKVPSNIVQKSASLPDELKTATLEVVYRANHPKITEDTNGDFPEDYEVNLPYSHLQALLYFIASRIHNPIGISNEFHAGNNYAAKFEAECQRLEHEGLQVDAGTGNTRAERGGWV